MSIRDEHNSESEYGVFFFRSRVRFLLDYWIWSLESISKSKAKLTPVEL